MLARIALILALASPARAGLICESEGDGDVKRLEAYARDKTKLEDGGLGMFCAGKPKYKARIEKACKVIIDREGAKSQCFVTAALAGLTMAGKHDVFAWILAQPETPHRFNGFWSKPTLLAATGDPRAAAAIVELWKTSIPAADEWEKKKRTMQNWSSWRQRAAAALGTAGGESEIAFLEEQAKATVDRGVSRACNDAIAEIKKRMAAKP